MSIESASGGVSLRVAEYFAANPKAMTVVAARELELPEADVLRNLPGGMATELVTDRFAEMMDRLAGLGRVHVIASNRVTTLEAFGEFGNFSTWGEYFNVQTKSLDMHIRFAEIGSVFAVEKPGHLDGVATLSVQFYDCLGASAFKVFLSFGSTPPSAERRAWWTALRDEFALSDAR